MNISRLLPTKPGAIGLLFALIAACLGDTSLFQSFLSS